MPHSTQASLYVYLCIYGLIDRYINVRDSAFDTTHELPEQIKILSIYLY